MSTIQYKLLGYIDGEEKADIYHASSGPFQAFHVGEEFVPDPNLIDRPGYGYRITAIRHLVKGRDDISHTVELDLASFTR